MEEKIKAYCHKCKKVVTVENPSKMKMVNERSRSGTIEAWQGKCQCGNKVFKIIGHG